MTSENITLYPLIKHAVHDQKTHGNWARGQFINVDSVSSIDPIDGRFYHSTDEEIPGDRLLAANELAGGEVQWWKGQGLSGHDLEVAQRGDRVWLTELPQTDFGEGFVYEVELVGDDPWGGTEGVYYDDINIRPEGQRITRRFRLGELRKKVEKHFGPGPHKGTGTPQAVHSKDISVGAAARAAHLRAQTVESEFSDVIKRVAASRSDVEFFGWENRVKTLGSIKRKLFELMKFKNLGLDEAIEDLKDINRYTLVFSQVDGILERGTNDVVDALSDEGWDLMVRADRVHFKNYFATRDDAYDGINANFERGDQRVEVQFHTAASAIKKEESWEIYQDYREMDWGTKKAKTLFQDMVGIWADGSHLPEDIPQFAFGMEV